MDLLKRGAPLVGRGPVSWEVGRGAIGGGGSLGQPSDSGQALQGQVGKAN